MENTAELQGLRLDLNQHQERDRLSDQQAKYQFINLSHIDNRLFNGPAPLHKKQNQKYQNSLITLEASKNGLKEPIAPGSSQNMNN